MKKIPLNSLQTFVKAASNLSFKKTAEELFVTPGAVSKQISSLELYLGIALFERGNKEIKLSKEGTKYLKKVSPALRIIETATIEIRSSGSKPTLNIETSPTFALHWLIPRLGDFKRNYPDIEIVLSTSSYAIDPHTKQDLYIRRDPKQFSGLLGESFMTEYSQLVCCKDLLKKNQSIEALLKSIPLINIKTRSELWRQWFESNNLEIESKEVDLVFENTIFAIQAAIEGLGIAMIPQLFLSHMIKNNILVSPEQSTLVATGQYYFIRNESQSSIVEYFIDWLITQK